MDKSSDSLTSGESGHGNTEPDDSKFLYETQHLGFTPISLLNGMFNAACDLYREALKAFCKTCSEKYPNVMSEDDLRKARHAVGELIDKDICMIFDTLEYYLLHEVFTVPENVVLPEDKCQLQRLSETPGEDLERQKDDLKKQIIAVRCANALLNQHLKDSEALQTACDQVLAQLSSKSRTSHTDGNTVKDWISYHSEMLKNGLNVKRNINKTEQEANVTSQCCKEELS